MRFQRDLLFLSHEEVLLNGGFDMEAAISSQVYAQSDAGKQMPNREGMMNEGCTCPMMSGMMGGMGMHGAGGTIIIILTVVLFLAVIAVLIAATVYLIRKSQR